ncbi:MAG TPA: XVIPCD domain-containing protein, partial [Pseudoxanthomonas sp.]|nr:XVIPCD domain-containing protein [Pseudoxanthomonas sp.]
RQALDAVDLMVEKHHLPHSDKSERLAAAITGATQPIPKFQIGHLELVAGTVTVHSRRDNFAEPPLSVRVDTNQAIARSPEQHAAAWQAQAVPGSQPAVAQARLPSHAPDQLPAQDLRHPQHPRHRLYAQAGDALAATYAQIGLPRSPEQLEREALGLAVASRQSHLQTIDGVKLMPDAQGQYGLASNLMAYQGDPELAGASRALVPAAALQVPTEQSVAQFSQVDLAVQLAQQEQQRRQQERNAQASQGPTMG